MASACSSPCALRFADAVLAVDGMCPRAPAPLFLGAFCRRNARGELCGAVAAAAYSALTAVVGDSFIAGPMPAADPSVCATLPAGPLAAAKVAGCCFRDLVEARAGQLGPAGVAYALDLFGRCGADTTSGCLGTRDRDGAVNAYIVITVTGAFNQTRLDALKAAIAGDLAAFLGIDPARVTVTAIIVDPAAARKRTARASSQSLRVEFSVVGEAGTSLASLQGNLTQASANLTLPNLNTVLAQDGASAQATTTPKNTTITPANAVNPSSPAKGSASNLFTSSFWLGVSLIIALNF